MLSDSSKSFLKNLFTKDNDQYYNAFANYFMVNNHSMYQEERARQGSSVTFWESSFFLSEKDSGEIKSAQKKISKLKLPYKEILKNKEILHGICLALDFHKHACYNVYERKSESGSTRRSGQNPYPTDALWALSLVLDEKEDDKRKNQALQLLKAFNQVIKISDENKLLIEKKLKAQVKAKEIINRDMLKQMLDKISERIMYQKELSSKDGRGGASVRLNYLNKVSAILNSPKQMWIELTSDEVDAIYQVIEDEAKMISAEFFKNDIVGELHEAIGIGSMSNTRRLKLKLAKSKLENIYSYDFYNRIVVATRHPELIEEVEEEDTEEISEDKPDRIPFPVTSNFIDDALHKLLEEGFQKVSLDFMLYDKQVEHLVNYKSTYESKFNETIADVSGYLDLIYFEKDLLNKKLNICDDDKNINMAILTRKLFFVLWKIDGMLDGLLNKRISEDEKLLSDLNHEFNQLISNISSGKINNNDKIGRKMITIWEGIRDLVDCVPLESTNFHSYQGDIQFVAFHPDILLALVKLKSDIGNRNMEILGQSTLIRDFEKREFRNMVSSMDDYFHLDPALKKG